MTNECKSNFAIFCFPRTGSYRLTDILNRNGLINCYGEVFKKKRIELPAELLQYQGLKKNQVKRRDEDPIAFLNKTYGYDQSRVSGFKIFPGHNNVVFDYLLSDASIKKVFLARNPVQSYISGLVAKQTGQWVLKNDNALDLGELKVKFDFYEFKKHVLRQLSAFNKIKFGCIYSGSQLFCIDYFDTFDDQKLKELVAFLGGDPSNIQESSHKKLINKSYHDIVDGYADVESFMSKRGLCINDSFFDFFGALGGFYKNRK